MLPSPNFIDLTDQKFGRLAVVAYVKGSKWQCLCDCGSTCVVPAGNLKTGNTKSCGCLRRELPKTTKRTHGHAAKGRQSPEYKAWCSLKDRCYRVTDPGFANYGGRGITVCRRWRGSDGFTNFLADMGPRPGPDYSIDRRKNHLGYSKKNCRWATPREQARNRRSNRQLTCRGQTRLMIEWADGNRHKMRRIHARLAAGWTVEAAIFTPINLAKVR